MEDYRIIQLNELTKKIEETKILLEDPDLCDLAQKEIAQLEDEKKQLEASLTSPQDETDDTLDQRNAILEVSGAAGGEEAKIWADELILMYTRFAQLK